MFFVFEPAAPLDTSGGWGSLTKRQPQSPCAQHGNHHEGHKGMHHAPMSRHPHV
jgi:hypothetical protein